MKKMPKRTRQYLWLKKRGLKRIGPLSFLLKIKRGLPSLEELKQNA